MQSSYINLYLAFMTMTWAQTQRQQSVPTNSIVLQRTHITAVMSQACLCVQESMPSTLTGWRLQTDSCWTPQCSSCATWRLWSLLARGSSSPPLGVLSSVYRYVLSRPIQLPYLSCVLFKFSVKFACQISLMIIDQSISWCNDWQTH